MHPRNSVCVEVRRTSVQPGSRNEQLRVDADLGYVVKTVRTRRMDCLAVCTLARWLAMSVVAEREGAALTAAVYTLR